jgi:hypothetical protein
MGKITVHLDDEIHAGLQRERKPSRAAQPRPAGPSRSIKKSPWWLEINPRTASPVPSGL